VPFTARWPERSSCAETCALVPATRAYSSRVQRCGSTHSISLRIVDTHSRWVLQRGIILDRLGYSLDPHHSCNMMNPFNNCQIYRAIDHTRDKTSGNLDVVHRQSSQLRKRG